MNKLVLGMATIFSIYFINVGNADAQWQYTAKYYSSGNSGVLAIAGTGTFSTLPVGDVSWNFSSGYTALNVGAKAPRATRVAQRSLVFTTLERNFTASGAFTKLPRTNPVSYGGALAVTFSGLNHTDLLNALQASAVTLNLSLAIGGSSWGTTATLTREGDSVVVSMPTNTVEATGTVETASTSSDSLTDSASGTSADAQGGCAILNKGSDWSLAFVLAALLAARRRRAA